CRSARRRDAQQHGASCGPPGAAARAGIPGRRRSGGSERAERAGSVFDAARWTNRWRSGLTVAVALPTGALTYAAFCAEPSRFDIYLFDIAVPNENGAWQTLR